MAPYGQASFTGHKDTRVQRDTWNPVGIREDHLARLNTPQRPIANKYREGKVKSTPARGVKETLKPCAYKPLRPQLIFMRGWQRTFCIMSQRVTFCRKVKPPEA